MKFISLQEIKSAVTLKSLFDPVKKSLIDYSSGNVIASPVNLLHFPAGGDAHIKIAAVKDQPYFSIKVATMFPVEGVPQSNGAILLFDAARGSLAAVLKDEGYLTDLRTAAAGALATDLLASSVSTNVCIVGTGIQARFQILAIAQLRKIAQINIWGRSEDKAKKLKSSLQRELPEVSVKVNTNLEQAVKESDIIITATSSTTPLIRGEWLRKGQHITAVGADDSYKFELDHSCFEVADRIYVDSIALNKQYGDLRNIFNTSSVQRKVSELGAYFTGVTAPNKSEITIAKTVGLGVQDLAAASTVLKNMIYD